MSAEKKKAFKSILAKAGKTFVQAFVSYLSIDGFFGITDLNALKKIALSLLVGAVAAGISAVWNSLVEWLTVKIDDIDADAIAEEIEKALDKDEEESEDDN